VVIGWFVGDSRVIIEWLLVGLSVVKNRFSTSLLVVYKWLSNGYWLVIGCMHSQLCKKFYYSSLYLSKATMYSC